MKTTELEKEMQILSKMIWDNDLIETYKEIYNDTFKNELNKQLYLKMLELKELSVPVNYLRLRKRLADCGFLSEKDHKNYFVDFVCYSSDYMEELL